MGQRLIDAIELPKLFDAEYKQTMERILSGEKQLDNLAEGFAEAIHIVKYIAPTVDAVPVIRCRDCQYWDDDPDTYGRSGGPLGSCDRMGCTTAHDDFCSNWERR